MNALQRLQETQETLQGVAARLRIDYAGLTLPELAGVIATEMITLRGALEASRAKCQQLLEERNGLLIRITGYEADTAQLHKAWQEECAAHRATQAALKQYEEADTKPVAKVEPLSAFVPSRHEGGPDGVLCLHFSQIPDEFFDVQPLWESVSGTEIGANGVRALADRYWRPLHKTWAAVHAAAISTRT